MRKILLLIVILMFVGPCWLLMSGQVNLTRDWHLADRSSAGFAPDPVQHQEAIVQVYAARAFHWRGLFAVHTWVAVKPQGALHYRVYQIVGWRMFQRISTLVVNEDLPDRRWFGQNPEIILDIRGDKAAELIPEIEQAAERYPYANRYHLWPGPNSNTFVAYIARQVPSLGLALPSTAVGKDYLGLTSFFAKAPSGTGYQFSLWGLLGVLLAKKEGLEINLLGLVFGFVPSVPAVELPGIGIIKLRE